MKILMTMSEAKNIETTLRAQGWNAHAGTHPLGIEVVRIQTDRFTFIDLVSSDDARTQGFLTKETTR